MCSNSVRGFQRRECSLMLQMPSDKGRCSWQGPAQLSAHVEVKKCCKIGILCPLGPTKHCPQPSSYFIIFDLNFPIWSIFIWFEFNWFISQSICSVSRPGDATASFPWGTLQVLWIEFCWRKPSRDNTTSTDLLWLQIPRTTSLTNPESVGFRVSSIINAMFVLARQRGCQKSSMAIWTNFDWLFRAAAKAHNVLVLSGFNTHVTRFHRSHPSQQTEQVLAKANLT